MLVVPKTATPSDTLEANHQQEVTFILPEEDTWYLYDTKLRDSQVGYMRTEILSDLQHATWIKGGSILPILNHQNCMALLSCIENSINLEIYLDDSQKASGFIYLDDGKSYGYQDSQDGSAIIQFNYDASSTITSENISKNNY